MGQYSFVRCRLLSVVVGVVCMLPTGGPAAERVGGRPPPGRARGRSGGRHCTAGQYSYVPLWRHLAIHAKHWQILKVTVDCRCYVRCRLHEYKLYFVDVLWIRVKFFFTVMFCLVDFCAHGILICRNAGGLCTVRKFRKLSNFLVCVPHKVCMGNFCGVK